MSGAADPDRIKAATSATAAASAASLPRWREEDPALFRATLLTAAERLDIQPLAVQKDYWVCEALRAIEVDKPDAVIFKGGTSLEKLRIIQRFSEDLDLLVVGDFGGESATKTAMKQMITAAHQAVGGPEPSEPKSGGRRGSLHREAYLHPPLGTFDASIAATAATSTAIADPGRVLVELGQSGGRHPSRRELVTSLLTRQLLAADFDVAAYADLTPFSVQILHPGRSLLEKLLRVNNFTVNPDNPRHGWPRIGRQFYDIWALLGQSEVRELLIDRVATAEILDDCYACPAFDVAGPFSSRLRAEHEAAMRGLYYGAGPGVSFDEVLRRIAENTDLLDVHPIDG